ncbi:MAG: hypothetical protein AB1421_06600 [Pseudomonadota bacterium]
MQARLVRLGVAGWLWPAWEDGFYPADMPPEWRLTYYNTQFSCVFLTRGQWKQLSPREWEIWAEDTHDEFLFLLETQNNGGNETPPAPLQGRAQLLSAQDSCLIWFDAESDLKTLAAQLSALPDSPHFLLSKDGDLGQIERVRTLLDLMGLAC